MIKGCKFSYRKYGKHSIIFLSHNFIQVNIIFLLLECTIFQDTSQISECTPCFRMEGVAISVLACRQLLVHLYSLIYCPHRPTNFIHIFCEIIQPSGSNDSPDPSSHLSPQRRYTFATRKLAQNPFAHACITIHNTSY